MQEHIKIDIALQLISSIIADLSDKYYKMKDENIKKQIDILLEERAKIYSGDRDTLEMVLSKYGRDYK